MAKRFGGRYSPGGTDETPAPAPLDSARVDAGAGVKANLMFLPPVVLAATSLGSGPVVLVTALVGAAILGLGAWLTREGLRAEAAYDDRKVARRPALPRKMLGSALTGVGIAIAGWTGDAGLIGAVLYGVAAAGLHVAAFGIDPLRDKLVEGIDEFQQDRVARVVDEAEAYLDTIWGKIQTTDARALQDRVASFCATARRMIRTVEEDPRDLTGARKFLGVYLMGARDATVKFVEIWNRKKDSDARAAYEALLEDLEQNFAARTERMMLDDRSDMDIEIKVLRDRLQREGV
ncbi:5-bromo-4-chloroindolyl phosphate hydrolysis family protein [Roseisalinus antarcticus]|uniref:5-bromo-4-chloroindolyl phosphate hydrolysis protein n=1 Tax=Roseisalinus antarcticus TaxID=254357 RepID=A0A1Y5RZW3_9RHOB|nr:5-bromo-4-chloroindolyl phosphate hydrolysis family protein [Roseisalinus antarcticus]SLN28012.1 5-bromo-4-chloroindolyl phosphate hydrolysis protein [Roseisalinus antarcticus]